MTSRVKFFLFVGFVLVLLGVLSYLLLKEQPYYFMAAELGIILLLFWAIYLYRSLTRTGRLLSTGLDAIEDKDFNLTLVKTGTKDLDQLIEVYNRMMENIRTERVAVQEQHYFLQKMINASPDGIIILDYDHRLNQFNPRAAQLFALENEHLQKPLHTLEHPFLRRIAQLEPGASTLLQTDNSQRFRVEVASFVHRGFPRTFVQIQELSKELLETEKRAYGKVIRMMAHEVNNSIGAINSILETIHQMEEWEQIEDGAEWKESLAIAMERNEQLNLFMRNFASVIRLPEPQLERIELQKLLQRLGLLMQVQWEQEQITWQIDTPAIPVAVSIDPQQMEQALLNIMKNAAESIGEGGQIRAVIQANPWALIIEDNGAGIAPEDADQLFTPFFSTKPTGQGVGLTLVREILINHGFTFSLKTDPDG
ncbi:MAG: ATP-binding protein, partial [Bacteroidota bacterium]